MKLTRVKSAVPVYTLGVKGGTWERYRILQEGDAVYHWEDLVEVGLSEWEAVRLKASLCDVEDVLKS